MRNFISIDCFVRRLSHPATHRFFFFLFLFCLPNFCFGGFTNFVDYRFITQCTSPTKSQSSSVDCPGEYVDYCCLGVSRLCQKRTRRSRFIFLRKTWSGKRSNIILLVFAFCVAVGIFMVGGCSVRIVFRYLLLLSDSLCSLLCVAFCRGYMYHCLGL